MLGDSRDNFHLRDSYIRISFPIQVTAKSSRINLLSEKVVLFDDLSLNIFYCQQILFI